MQSKDKNSGTALTYNLVFVTKAQVGGNPPTDYADSGRRAGRNRIGLGFALRPNLKNAE